MGKIWDKDSVMDRMRTLCSRREYCSADILKKASSLLDGQADIARGIVEELKECGYVDDLRYSSAYARDKSSISGWGPKKIMYMLAAKGIAADVILAALEDIDAERADRRLEKLLACKAASLRNDPMKRFKLIRYAVGRGYAYEDASSAVDGMNEN